MLCAELPPESITKRIACSRSLRRKHPGTETISAMLVSEKPSSEYEGGGVTAPPYIRKDECLASTMPMRPQCLSGYSRRILRGVRGMATHRSVHRLLALCKDFPNVAARLQASQQSAAKMSPRQMRWMGRTGEASLQKNGRMCSVTHQCEQEQQMLTCRAQAPE